MATIKKPCVRFTFCSWFPNKGLLRDEFKENCPSATNNSCHYIVGVNDPPTPKSLEEELDEWAKSETVIVGNGEYFLGVESGVVSAKAAVAEILAKHADGKKTV